MRPADCRAKRRRGARWRADSTLADVAPQVIEAERPVAVVDDERPDVVGVVDRYRLVDAMYADRS